jgi:hypothetical protein
MNISCNQIKSSGLFKGLHNVSVDAESCEDRQSNAEFTSQQASIVGEQKSRRERFFGYIPARNLFR